MPISVTHRTNAMAVYLHLRVSFEPILAILISNGSIPPSSFLSAPAGKRRFSEFWPSLPLALDTISRSTGSPMTNCQQKDLSKLFLRSIADARSTGHPLKADDPHSF